MDSGKKFSFKIPKKPRPPEEDASKVPERSKLTIKEKLERAKKLAASLGKSSGSSGNDKGKSSSNNHKSSSENHKSSSENHKSLSVNHKSLHKSSSENHKSLSVNHKSLSENHKSSSKRHKEETSSHSNHNKSDNKHSNDKDVKKQTEKKPAYLEKLAKLTDEQKMEIIKKISGSLGRKDDKISDEEKLDKIRKISETIGKGPVKSEKAEKVNGSQKYSSPLTGKVDRDKYSGSIESLQKMKKDLKQAEEIVQGKTITMLGKTDEGIKREVKHFDRVDAEKMRQALQEKAARIKAVMVQPEEPKPRERRKRKENVTESDEKLKKSRDSASEETRKSSSSSDTRKSSSHSSDKYSSDRNIEKPSKEEKPVKKKKLPPPPSMNFSDLLKIAEVKSQEPIVIEKVVKKPVEEERLMRKKEIRAEKEYQEYLEYKARQKKMEKEERESIEVKKEKLSNSSKKSKLETILTSQPQSSSHSRDSTQKKNPYLERSNMSKSASNITKNSSQHTVKKNPYVNSTGNKSSTTQKNPYLNNSGHKSSTTQSSSKMGQKSVSSSSIPSKPPGKAFKMQSSSGNSDRKQNSDSNHQVKKMKTKHSARDRTSSNRDNNNRKPSSAKGKNYDKVHENVLVCGPQKGEKSTKPVSSNPFDRIYGEIKKNQPSRPAKRKHPDEYSDSDEELDEDMEGFVVDYLSSAEEEEMDDCDDDYEDYSKHIRDIFGYDKRKFKYESDYDIANMDANFRDVMKEEARSARLGMQEDLEDMKREEEELKRKAAAKKKKR